jgi:hypothetical protein
MKQMCRKLIILLLFVLSLIVKAETYYVCQDSTWNTISDITGIVAGDSVLFHAGEVWRESMTVTSGSEGNRKYYGRYGTGDNPKILGSTKAITWTETATSNIWQSATAVASPRSGHPSQIFFIENDSTTWGNFRTYSAGFTNLTTEYDWTWQTNVVYVYSTTDPDANYDSIEVPQRDACIVTTSNTNGSYLTFDGIDMGYSQGRGFDAGYPEVAGQSDLTFRNCNIFYVGEKNGSSAYGITAFHSDFLVENCNFNDIGRRSISVNMYTLKSGNEIYLDNIVVRNNTFKRGYHSTSLDLAAENVCVGDTVQNVYYYNNRVDDHENPWIDANGDRVGTNQYYIQQGEGAYFNNIYCVNNVFIQSTRRNILITDGADTNYIWNNTIVGHDLAIHDSPYSNVAPNCLAIDYRNNILYSNWTNAEAGNNYGILPEYAGSSFVNRDYNLYWQVEEDIATNTFTGDLGGYYIISEWTGYLAENSTWDNNSPVPTNPYFVDYGGFDFHLMDSSVAIGAGTPLTKIITDGEGNLDTIGKYDIEGNIRGLYTTSIGAYEYVPVMRTVQAITASDGTPSLAYNNNLDYWTASGTQWIQFEFDTIYSFDQVVLRVYDGANRLYYYSVSYSLNGTDFTTILDEDTTESGNLEFNNLMFGEVVQAKYIRITGTGNSISGTNNYQEIFFPPLQNMLTGRLNDTLRILFCGNSFSEEYLEGMVARIAASGGYYTPITEVSILGGQDLNDHLNSAQTLNLIRNVGEIDWDHVVLQDLSTRTLNDTVQMYLDVTDLYDTIKKYNNNAIVTLFETWATPADIVTLYTTHTQESVDNYFITQAVIHKGYTHAMDSAIANATYEVTTDIEVAHVGDAWAEVLARPDYVQLHNAGGTDHHPCDTGKFLNGLQIYATIYNMDVTPVWWQTVPVETANVMKEICDTINSGIIVSGETEDVLSWAKNIVTFTIPSQVGNSTINTTAHTVSVTMPYGTDITNLTPTITVSIGASIDPLSGVSQNFTNPVTYTTTAEDLTTQEWVVTVTTEGAPEEPGTEFQVFEMDGMIFIFNDLILIE